MSLLDFVPRQLRSRWPFRRYFWQAEEIAAAKARACETATVLGWGREETTP